MDIYKFENGPLDGATLSLPVDIYAAEIRVALPAKAPGDSDDRFSALAVHTYVNYCATEMEGEEDMAHTLIHDSVEMEKVAKGGLDDFDKTIPKP